MKRGRFVPCAVVALAGMMFLDTNMAAQIMQIGEMNTHQIRALDLARTVILMPGDILEEHGPYLPSFTDGYADDAYTHEGHRRKTRLDRRRVSPDSAGQPAGQ